MHNRFVLLVWFFFGIFALKKTTGIMPLFTTFAALEKNIAYIPLGRFPTPIESVMINQPVTRSIYIKRDDLSGMLDTDGKQLFGGNKVRKLSAVCLYEYCRALVWLVLIMQLQQRSMQNSWD